MTFIIDFSEPQKINRKVLAQILRYMQEKKLEELSPGQYDKHDPSFILKQKIVRRKRSLNKKIGDSWATHTKKREQIEKSLNPHDQFRFQVVGDELGGGTCAKVFKSEITLALTSGGDDCTIKFTKKRAIKFFNTNQWLLRPAEEAIIANQGGLKTKPVLNNNSSIMVMEEAYGKELFALINDGNVNKDNFYSTAIQIAVQINSLHQKGYLHRDLKPENIVVNLIPPQPPVIKIVDYGFSQKINEHEPICCGTPEYIAPEVLAEKPYSERIDIFSFGRILLDMLESNQHYHGLSQSKIFKYTEEGKDKQLALTDIRLDIDNREELLNFIKRMLDTDAKKRPTAMEVILKLNNLAPNEQKIHLQKKLQGQGQTAANVDVAKNQFINEHRRLVNKRTILKVKYCKSRIREYDNLDWDTISILSTKAGSRSAQAFKNLGWFNKKGQLTEEGKKINALTDNSEYKFI
ncbi:protein kinase domain-containing protein [Legionella israelensis]|uniref:Serine/threonine-protein kinase n=1 Tax=Legionella israelensis TaxID=454 RepID=A0A0W0VK96_9GAMM|nr:protein kinase [Legionella israelensis]KTD20233.1 serine/threonine-protein kinase [Legionella israelensis]QBS09020.1 serine/threonine-protein kinase [Legionella israelensis]SCY39880.1 Serine/threonine protein kinase [Legionella israelensis DSM 19235]STX58725.1 Serine/threonine protein kinase [Legionella israelensis]